MADDDPFTFVETVDDDDDDDDDVDDAETAAMEATREKAEARKKRILEKANQRMNYVNGEQVDNGDAEQKKSVSSAARIRAARQRRYGKKKADTSTTTEETTTTTNEAAVAADSTTSTEQPDSKILEPTVSATENTTTADETKKEESDDEAIPVDEPVEKSEEGPETSDDGTGKKKKYLGVARMRRQMLARKKMERENAEENSNDNATATVPPASISGKTKAVGVTAAVGKVVLPPVKIQTIPIYMHILVVVLLFVTGYDVGSQQFHSEVDVPTQVAVQEYGVPFVHRNPWQPLTKIVSAEKDAKRALEDELRQKAQGERTSPSVVHDEFQEIIHEEYIPNIDPLFGVDLDEMTAGPGILNKLAKGAIAIHRSLLWFVYYAPMGIFSSILSIPSALMQTPPALFLSTIMLRQVLGKLILGATIPVIGDDNGDGKSQNKLDILNMGKNFVKNFFVTSFPKVVTLYETFVHLKSDMYIVLCGVFFGLAWTHINNTCDAPPIMSDESGMTDEL
ncbi:MAG: hypothetical protein ACI8RD_004187 [Bacillariaceae sp.]|jgi:hypothetical protein